VHESRKGKNHGYAYARAAFGCGVVIHHVVSMVRKLELVGHDYGQNLETALCKVFKSSNSCIEDLKSDST
jgi:hypothetical protein